jgi:hypothetical protein
LDEVLEDPMVRLVARRDGLTIADLRAALKGRCGAARRDDPSGRR